LNYDQSNKGELGCCAETYKLWEVQSNMYAKIMKEMGIIK
jgi:hypothetical protein